MSTASNHRNANGVAFASVALGIITLLMIWAPIIHLVPGLVAVALGTIAVRRARRGTAGGEGVAKVGILFATIGMLPTVTIALAMAIAGVRGMVQAYGQVPLFEGGTIGATLSIQPWYADDAFMENEIGGVSTSMLKSPDGYIVEAETLHIDVDGQRSDIQGTYSVTSLEAGKSPVAAKVKSFAWESPQTDLIRYRGILQFSPRSVELKLSLENKVPCQLAVEGLRDAWATEWPSSKQIRDAVASDGNQAISLDPIPLDQPLPPGTHSIRIVGYVLSEVP